MSKTRKFREVDQPGSDTAQLGRTIALDEESANNLVAYQNERGLQLWEEIKTPARPVTQPEK